MTLTDETLAARFTCRDCGREWVVWRGDYLLPNHNRDCNSKRIVFTGTAVVTYA